MNYLNVNIQGLSGHPHPALYQILNVQEIEKVRAHLKFLTCDLNYRSHEDTEAMLPCALCETKFNSLEEHSLLTCIKTLEIRSRMYPELVNAVAQIAPSCRILRYNPPSNILAQFVLDCTSFNLPADIRLPLQCTNLGNIFRVARDWCFAILKYYKRTITSQPPTVIEDDLPNVTLTNN